MAWKMTFDYDEEHDVVTASFEDCILNNSLDVARWRTEVEGHLSKYPSKVDLLINLDGLVVKYTAGRVFGRERSEVLARYTLRSFRFGGDEDVRQHQWRHQRRGGERLPLARRGPAGAAGGPGLGWGRSVIRQEGDLSLPPASSPRSSQ
jgi:hypothetical protein